MEDTIHTPKDEGTSDGGSADFSECYLRYFDPLVSMLSKRTTKEKAEDAAQCAFERILHHWSRLCRLSEPERKAYVYQAAKNSLIDIVRKEQAFPGGPVLTLDSWLSYNGSRWDRSGEVINTSGATLGGRGGLCDHNPEHQPEQVVLAREELAEIVAGQGSTLKATDMLLLASGYRPKQVAARMHRLARLHPADPHAYRYSRISPSGIKMRRSRRQSRLRKRKTQETQD